MPFKRTVGVKYYSGQRCKIGGVSELGSRASGRLWGALRMGGVHARRGGDYKMREKKEVFYAPGIYLQEKFVS